MTAEENKRKNRELLNKICKNREQLEALAVTLLLSCHGLLNYIKKSNEFIPLDVEESYCLSLIYSHLFAFNDPSKIPKNSPIDLSKYGASFKGEIGRKKLAACLNSLYEDCKKEGLI
jgi:hypothetical protein